MTNDELLETIRNDELLLSYSLDAEEWLPDTKEAVAEFKKIRRWKQKEINQLKLEATKRGLKTSDYSGWI